MPIGMKGVNKTERRVRSEDTTTEQAVPEVNEAVDDLRDNAVGRGQRSGGGAIKVLPIVIIVVIIIGIGGVLISKVMGAADAGASTDTESSADSQENGGSPVYDENGEIVSSNGIYDADGNVIAEGAIDPGIKEYNEDSDEADRTTATVYSSTDYIKDLNGVDVSAVYNVKDRTYVYDYVNYEMRRAIIDDGMEMYWLEVVYNEKKYRIQIPFYRFRMLKDKGICKVQLELLTLEGGEKIISYMQVVDDDAGIE